MKKRRASHRMGRASLLALISMMMSAGCATLSGLSSLDEVQCVDNCDGSTGDKDSGVGTDSSSGGEDGAPGDATSDADAAPGDGATKDGAMGDAGGSVITCGSKSCSGFDPECCAGSGANMTSCEPSLAYCLDGGDYGFSCTKTSDCTLTTTPVCCLNLGTHAASCTSSAACPLAAGSDRRLCDSAFLADPICGASYDCMVDMQFSEFNSCQ